ncbi:hypothetical protein ACXYFN_03255 [Mycoplasma sp. 48589B]
MINDKLVKDFEHSQDNTGDAFWLQKSLRFDDLYNNKRNFENNWLNYLKGEFGTQFQKEFENPDVNLDKLIFDKLMINIQASYLILQTFKLDNNPDYIDITEAFYQSPDGMLKEDGYYFKIPATELLTRLTPEDSYKYIPLHERRLELKNFIINGIKNENNLNLIDDNFIKLIIPLIRYYALISKPYYITSNNTKNKDQNFDNEIKKYNQAFFDKLITSYGFKNTIINIINYLISELKIINSSLSLKTPLIATFNVNYKRDFEAKERENQVLMSKELLDTLIKNLENDLEILR